MKQKSVPTSPSVPTPTPPDRYRVTRHQDLAIGFQHTAPKYAVVEDSGRYTRIASADDINLALRIAKLINELGQEAFTPPAETKDIYDPTPKKVYAEALKLFAQRMDANPNFWLRMARVRSNICERPQCGKFIVDDVAWMVRNENFRELGSWRVCSEACSDLVKNGTLGEHPNGDKWPAGQILNSDDYLLHMQELERLAENSMTKVMVEDDVKFHIKSVAGRVLTLVDALVSSPAQNSAFKSLMKKEFREQLKRVWGMFHQDANCGQSVEPKEFDENLLD